MKDQKYWRKFLEELQEGTNASRSPAEQKAAYDKAFKIISKPQNMISCMSVKDVHLRIEMIRRFPFLAFRYGMRGLAKIARKLI